MNIWQVFQKILILSEAMVTRDRNTDQSRLCHEPAMDLDKVFSPLWSSTSALLKTRLM